MWTDHPPSSRDTFETTSCLLRSDLNYVVLIILSGFFMTHSAFRMSLCFFQLPVLMETSASSAATHLLVLVSLNSFTWVYFHFPLFSIKNPLLDYCVLPIPFFVIYWLLVHSHLFIYVFSTLNILEEYEEVIFFSHRHPGCVELLLCGIGIYMYPFSWESVK